MVKYIKADGVLLGHKCVVSVIWDKIMKKITYNSINVGLLLNTMILNKSISI